MEDDDSSEHEEAEVDDDPSQWGFGQDQQDDEDDEDVDEWARNSGQSGRSFLKELIDQLILLSLSLRIQIPTLVPNTLDPTTNDDLNEEKLKVLDWEKQVLPDREELLILKMQREERKGWMIWSRDSSSESPMLVYC